MLGIIGGSGVYRLSGLHGEDGPPSVTPFGATSGPVLTGHIGGTDVAFIPRHGPYHRHSPSDLPYRANIHALKSAGATHLLSISAVGSMREDLPPRSRVLPDQIIDRTLRGGRSFFGDGVVAHVGIAEPFCPLFRAAVAMAGATAGAPVEMGGTYVCIEGPQFSTRAESRLYRSWGADVIGMTAMPEARLAREAELCYATLALVTDYDVWHESEDDVSVEIVVGHLRANSEAAAAIVEAIAERGLPERSCHCGSALDGAVMTATGAIDPATVARLAPIGERVFGDHG